MEIEPIYIVGDFALEFDGEPVNVSEKSYRISKQPLIASAPKTVDAAALDFAGFAEFAGEITLSRKFVLDSTNYHVMLRGRGTNAIRLKVNGKDVATKLYAPYRVELGKYLNEGENELEITVVNNLRNMMGPHHLVKEEERWVHPGLFYKESNIFAHPKGVGADCHDRLSTFDDSYMLVYYGITD
jgi:hypothetical protein